MSEPETGDLDFCVAQPVERVPSSSLTRIAITGLATCVGIFAIDTGVLEFAKFREWTASSVFLVFGVFIIQTALLGSFVGSKVKRESIWWLFFGWMLVLVNLILIMATYSSYSWTQASRRAFVFAFLNAQIGLVIFWGILGSTVWRRRIPIAFFLLVVCSYPYWISVAFSGTRWLGVMTCYIISVAATCTLLRLWRFRLGSKDYWSSSFKTGRIDQFGIKHLFIWTTIVAVLFGIGRLVPWTAIASTFVNQSTALLLTRALLMTMIVVVTAWTMLGDLRGAWIRGLILVGILIGVGFGLGLAEQYTTRPSGLVGWSLKPDEAEQIWFTWTTLNGLFLAGLLLVLRMSGSQLARIRTAKSEN